MMRRLVIVFMLCSIITTAFATKRALVIGIGDYPARSGWHKINGDKDVPLVVDMLKSQGFLQQNIITILNSKATYNGIIDAFNALIFKSQQGDIVYVHFSGHGQRITDIDGDEGAAGFDEAWVPYDAPMQYVKGKYEGKNHLVDDQLNKIFHQIRSKIGQQGSLIIVADACHSGGGSRDLEEDDEEQEWVQRGCSDDFIIPNKSTQHTQVSQNVEDWIYISACRSYQSNYEYKGAGSLTYALCQEKGNFSTFTAAQLIRRIQARINKLIPYTQTPELNAPALLQQRIFLQ